MGKILLLTLVALLAATPGFGQTGSICIFADSIGTSCNPVDSTASVWRVYVLHRNSPGATGAQFSAPKPNCMQGATWLADDPMFPVAVGNSQDGISLGYGSCLTGSFHVLTITYYVTGGTLDHCQYPILNDDKK